MLARERAEEAAEKLVEQKLYEDLEGEPPLSAAVGVASAIIAYNVDAKLGGDEALAGRLLVAKGRLLVP